MRQMNTILEYLRYYTYMYSTVPYLRDEVLGPFYSE